jgi:hypothetical protein
VWLQRHYLHEVFRSHSIDVLAGFLNRESQVRFLPGHIQGVVFPVARIHI